MNEVTRQNFGLLIAYVLPGFVALWGLSYFLPPIHAWLAAAPDHAPSIGGFLYATLASIAAGVTLSAVRWLLIDTLHHRTGVPVPDWDYAQLAAKLDAFESIAEDHYRYYQFYANMLVGIAVAYACYRLAHLADIWRLLPADAGFVVLAFVLLAGSRDALRKYYARVSRLLGTLSPEERSVHRDQRKAPQERPAGQAADEVSLG